MNGRALEHVDSTLQASRVRYSVLAVVCSISVVTYLDRVCIAGSAPFIISELGLTHVQMGFVFGAFSLAYAAFEAPSGWLGDKVGPRKVLSRIMAWWSAFTMLTGLVHHLSTLLAVRFLFGVGEAGAYPNITRVLSVWAAATRRGLAQGLVIMWGRLGGAFAPGLVILMIGRVGWRGSFWIFGAIGFVWAIFFWSWFRDSPKDKASVNEAELFILQNGKGSSNPRQNVPMPTSWWTIIRCRQLWALCSCAFCMGFSYWFFITWMPTYLKERGVSLMSVGIFGGLPLFLGAIGCAVGGLLTDYVVKRTGNLKNRRYVAFAAYLLAALCMLVSVRIKGVYLSTIVISMAAFFGDLTQGTLWATCVDIGEKLSGTISGWMNTWGNLGGFFSPVVTGLLVERFGNWNMPIELAGVFLLLGAMLWLRIDPSRPIVWS